MAKPGMQAKAAGHGGAIGVTLTSTSTRPTSPITRHANARTALRTYDVNVLLESGGVLTSAAMIAPATSRDTKSYPKWKAVHIGGCHHQIMFPRSAHIAIRGIDILTTYPILCGSRY